MNFSFDESGEMGSKTHSENFNLFYFLERCSNTIHCNILLEFSCSKTMFTVPLSAKLNFCVYAHPTLKFLNGYSFSWGFWWFFCFLFCCRFCCCCLFFKSAL